MDTVAVESGNFVPERVGACAVSGKWQTPCIITGSDVPNGVCSLPAVAFRSFLGFAIVNKYPFEIIRLIDLFVVIN